MPEIDTSIYGDLLKPHSPTEGLNALSTLQGITNQRASLQLLHNQNALFGQEYNANLAIGRAFQQASGPDGVDFNKAADLIASDPDAAYKAGDVLSKMYQSRGFDLDNKLKEFDLLSKKRGIYGEALAGLLTSKNPDEITNEDVADVVTKTHKAILDNGLDKNGADADMLIQFMAGLPAQGPARAQYLRGTSVTLGASKDALDRVAGQFSTEDLGGERVIIHTNPFTPNLPPTVVGKLDKTPTPEELNTLVPTVGSAGQVIDRPRGEVAPLYSGGGVQLNPRTAPLAGAAVGATPPAPGASAPMGQGGAPTGALAPAPAPFGGGVQAGTGPQTGLPIVAKGALDTDVGLGKDYATDLQHDVDSSSKGLLMLKQLQDVLAKWKPGAGSTLSQRLAQVAQFFGVPQEVQDKLAGGSLANLQMFEKYALQNAASTLSQQLTRQRITNLEFQQYTKALPNIDTDPRAAEKIIKNIKMIADLKVSEQAAFRRWFKAGKDPADFQNQWIEGLYQKGYLDKPQGQGPGQ